MENTNINVLYHGISFMYLNKFITCFNGPTSTTTKLSVAYKFAQPHNGIILELSKSNTFFGGDLKYFNCAPFSYYASEDERLFITPPHNKWYLETIAIRNLSSNEIYTKFMKSLTTLQTFVGDNADYNDVKHVIDSEIILSIYDLLNENNKIPSYIRVSFNKWTNTIKTIEMDHHYYL